jgi:hypothetical protein
VANYIIKTDEFPTLAEAVANSIIQNTITLYLASADYVIKYNKAEILRSIKALAIQEIIFATARRHLLLLDLMKSLRN